MPWRIRRLRCQVKMYLPGGLVKMRYPRQVNPANRVSQVNRVSHQHNQGEVEGALVVMMVVKMESNDVHRH